MDIFEVVKSTGVDSVDQDSAMSLQHAIHHHQLQQQLAKKQDRHSVSSFCQTYFFTVDSFDCFFQFELLYIVGRCWKYVGELMLKNKAQGSLRFEEKIDIR